MPGMLDAVACPTNCGSALPKVTFDKCAPEWRLSQFDYVVVGSADTTAFTDWTSPTEWTTRLDQEAITAGSLRLLTIRGNKPAPTETPITMTAERSIVTTRHHVLNWLIDELNDDNYDFIRTIECGGLNFRIWPITNAGKEIQGGNDGILVTAKGSLIYDEGKGTIQKAQGTFEWDSLQSPARALNPIAGF